MIAWKKYPYKGTLKARVKYFLNLFNNLVLIFNSSNDFVQAEKNVSMYAFIFLPTLSSYTYAQMHTHTHTHTHTHRLTYRVECMTGTILARGNIQKYKYEPVLFLHITSI